MFCKVLERGVTSKDFEGSNHLGYGLFYVNEVVSRLNGQMSIYTDDMMLQNQHGKLSITQISRWEGTLISINIPLLQAITIDDIEPQYDNNIKINFS